MLTGPEQTRGSVPSRPAVPVIGKDLIRSIYYPVRRKHAMYWAYYDPVRLAREQIPMLLDWGINSFFTTISAPAWKETAFKKDFPGEFDYLPRLVEMCHANGMLAGGSVVQMEKHSWYPDEVAAKLQKIGRCVDPLEALELQKQVTREIAATGADYVMLQDERAYSIHHGSKGTSRVAARLYREKFGEDPAILGREPEKYRQPSWHNTVFFQMDIWTRIMKELTQAGRQVNPKGVFFQVTSPSNMSRIWDGAPQDWERMAGHIEFCMDLYGKPKKLYKFYGKFMNAGNDNRRPHTIVSGCIMSAEELIANVAYNSMWWVSMNHMFPPRGYTYRNWLEEMQRLFQFYEHTGLGDLTLMPPVRRVAVLWDRAAMIDCIKHGEWTRTGSLSTVNVQNYVYINGLDLDIVMSKYFSRENLADYQFLIVPDERVLSDKLANKLKAFVEAGGTALVEGQCINNPVVRELCGVEPLADEPTTFALTGGPFPYIGPGVKVRNVSARVFVDFGGCAVYRRKVGEGTVLYAPMLLNRTMHTYEASAWLRQTIDRFAGKPLIQFRPTDYEALESSVASDGRKILLTIYNQAYGNQEFSFTWNGPAKPAGIVDFSRGEISRLDGPFADTVKGGQVKYYCIMRDREAYTIPAFEELPRGRDVAYTAAPGSHIIEIKPAAPQKTATTGRRDRRPGITYVGILSDAGREAEAYHSRITGDEAIKAALAGWRSLEVELMDNLSRAGLANYDVVIVPNYNQHALTRVLKIQGGWERRLRDYVQDGGAVMLLHRTVGYSCKEPPFPEIGVNAFQKVTDLRQFRITADHPVVNASSVFTRLPDDAKNPAYQAQMDALKMAVGRSFTGSFVDHIALKKGPAGRVVTVSEVNDAGLGGQPAIICGHFGKGKVVLCGLAIGDSIIESEGQRIRREKVGRGEDSILINAVYWLGEK